MQKVFNLTSQEIQELSKSRLWNEYEYIHSSMRIYFLIDLESYDGPKGYPSFLVTKDVNINFYDLTIHFDGFNFKYYLDDNQSENMHQFYKDNSWEEPLTTEELRDYLLSLGWIEIINDRI